MKNLFIDTNIWLSLYHFTNDDLTQFEKLKEYIGDSINLIVPQQVYDEIIRNREAKIKDALKDFVFKAPSYPVFCKGYDEYNEISEKVSNIIDRFKEWKSVINDDIQTQKLPADKIIASFMKKVNLIPCTNIVKKAYNRYLIGNPPGKDNKYGDAINWECLLENVDNGEDLYFISADKDYSSLLDSKKLNNFLAQEWENKKESKIIFYTNLVDFLNEHVKDIELQTEKTKDRLINRLFCSPSFQSTHSIISKLSEYSGWSEQQIEDLCSIVIDNGQVYRILGDDDVYCFYKALVSKFGYDDLDDCAIKKVIELLESIELRRDEDIRNNGYADMADALEDFFIH